MHERFDRSDRHVQMIDSDLDRLTIQVQKNKRDIEKFKQNEWFNGMNSGLLHRYESGGDKMKFDQVRREFKKTLWGEELDNECLVVENAQSIGPFQHGKSRCTKCSHELAENEMVLYHHKSFCLDCFQTVYTYKKG